jgi:DNA-binding NtrC family response regulator
LIAATNRDLEAMVSEQKFRSDLFFRLNVFLLRVPFCAVHGCDLDDWLQAERELQERFKDREMETRKRRRGGVQVRKERSRV